MKYLLPLVLLIVLALALSPAAESVQEGEIPLPLAGETIPCPIGLPAGEVEGETVVCGQIEVPENWDVPGDATVLISYVVLRTDNEAPFVDPILYFEGGPGGSAIEKTGEYIGYFDRLRDTRDVIIWDQRGTAYSSPLQCPIDVQVADVDEYDLQQSSFRDRIAAYDANTDPDVVYDGVAEFAASIDFSRCVPYFAEQGIDLSQYSTYNTVRDAVALMNHLGYPRYNLYGISYGTTVLLSIAEYYDGNPDLDLPSLRSGIIDGVFPLSFEWYEQAFIQPYNILRIFSDCEADAACGEAYPDIRQRAVDLLAALEETPLVREDDSEIAVDNLVEVLYAAVTTNQGLVPLLPRIVADLETGVTDGFDYAQSTLSTFDIPEAMADSAADGENKSEIDAIVKQLGEIQTKLAEYELGNRIVGQAALESDSQIELFVALLNEGIRTVPASAEIVYSVLEPLVIHPDQRTRDNLLMLAYGSNAKPVQEEMLSLTNLFTDEEVAAVYDLLLRPEYLSGLVGFEQFTTHTVDCNDRAASFFNDVAFEQYRAFEAPQLINSKVYLLAEWQIRCEQLGLNAAAYQPAPPDIVTDLPMLVMNGSIDPNTPVEWGEDAYEALTDAQMVTMPLAKHGTTTLSACARDIANAFFLSPGEELNLSCIDERQPVYLLPEDELPAMP